MLMHAVSNAVGLTSGPWLIVIAVIVIALRYMLFAGGAMLLLAAFHRSLLDRRIQPQPFTPGQLIREAVYSASTVLVFAAVGIGVTLLQRTHPMLHIYARVEQGGWLWFWASIPVAILIHDFYFYWAHRFMHLPGVFERVHRVHHLSTNPSPLAAFAFHPLEAVIEAVGLLFVAFVLPIHVAALALVGLYSTLTNVVGHLGHELLPAGLARSRGLGWLNTATSHNQHHRAFTANYGLYTLIWDRLFGTLHPQYQTLFARVTAPKVARPILES